MTRFSVLASGSSGNASLLEFNGFGLLIDAGLGPRQLAARLAGVGATWKNVSAVVLTHTHGDHWRERTLAHLAQHRIPLYCHAEHCQTLDAFSPSFAVLKKGGLAYRYDAGSELALTPHLRCRPLEVCHDCVPTFGFRFDGTGGLFGTSWSLGYLADLGCWSPALAAAVASVDVLALEFNHDEEMERRSHRPTALIERVLGDDGHLSNVQAANFLRAILHESGSDNPHHLVQLHLSRQCNRPVLAQAAARQVVNGGLSRPMQLHTANQYVPGPSLTIGPGPAPKRKPRVGWRPKHESAQPSLPGMD
jgi:ribonuclease BN (tRNA processing enzyme)